MVIELVVMTATLALPGRPKSLDGWVENEGPAPMHGSGRKVWFRQARDLEGSGGGQVAQATRADTRFHSGGSAVRVVGDRCDFMGRRG